MLGVVFYHLDLPWMPGGFLGVDVFFVLSGFLITTLLVEEVEQSGRVRLRAFYWRRARRLLPALVLVLAVVALLALLLFPGERSELRRDSTAALLYVSNWSYVLHDQSYFEAMGRPPLLQHLWSLSVEEQFYLLWPAVVGASMVAGRRRLRNVALAGAAISTLWMAVLAVRNGYPLTNDPSRAYFGTDTHAMGLLLGAAMATCWSPWRLWQGDCTWVRSRTAPGQRAGAAIADLAGVLGLSVVVWSFARVSEFSPLLYRGGLLAVSACTALVVAAVAHPAGLLGRALGSQPLRYVGRRSYGIYLWHWPVVLLTRPGFELPFGGWFSVLVRLAIIVSVAELSYRYVERPIRETSFAEWAGRLLPKADGSRTRITDGAAAPLALSLVTIGVLLFTAPASGTSLHPDGQEVVQPPPDSAPGVSPMTVADGRSTGSTRTAEDRRCRISVFGDSVVYGASYQLQAAGAQVFAAEGRTFRQALAALGTARLQGRLGRTVVVHVGTNGPAEEAVLVQALDGLDHHDVYLVNLSVPRTWENYNNRLFDTVARRYPNVTLLDWKAQTADHPEWLYPDQVHLTAESGRDGYAHWLLQQVRSDPSAESSKLLCRASGRGR